MAYNWTLAFVNAGGREGAARLVLDDEGQHGSRWQAVMSISSKIGCAPQTLNEWVKKAEIGIGKRLRRTCWLGASKLLAYQFLRA